MIDAEIVEEKHVRATHGLLRTARPHIAPPVVRRSSAHTGDWRGAITPGVNPGDRVAAEHVPADPGGVRRARRTRSAAGLRQRRRPRPPAAQRRSDRAFEGFDFSAPAEGPGGGDVHRVVRRRVSGRRARGDDADARRRPRSRRAGFVSTTPCLAEHGAVDHAAGSMSGAAWATVACAAAGGLPGVRRPGIAALGARTHGVHRRCETCDGEGQIVAQTCRTCGAAWRRAAASRS